MTIEEARKSIQELRERFDAPFSSSDKTLIEALYYEVLGKTFHPTSCQTCYHDAVIEIYLRIKNYGKMAKKSNYRLKAGAIINCPIFENGKVYSNDNLTDEVAKSYLAKFPKNSYLFQVIPTENGSDGADDGGVDNSNGADAKKGKNGGK